jgi:Bacterial SH3 domain/Transglycosylase SLT domain
MLLGNGGNNPKQSTHPNTHTAYQNTTESQLGKSYRFQLNQKSSFDSNVKGSKAASTSAQKATTKAESFNSWNATQNAALPTSELYVRSAKATSTANPRQWNASFLNRNSSNVADYNSYDFSRPVATRSLGGRGSGGKTAAQLKIDFGNGSPTRNVQSDNFALQAWTRVKLKEGRFYKASSDSNDGTRFFFKERGTGKVLTDLGSGELKWDKVLSVPKGGKYDFYVQYYEKSGRSAINVKLEEVEQTGRVVNGNGLNVRRTPSSTGNTPFQHLDSNTTFKILRQVKSTDANNPSWYEIVTRAGKRGFVSADSGLSEVVGGAVVLGGNSLIPDKPPVFTPPSGGGGGGGSSIPSKGFVKGGVTFRTGPGTGESILGDLSQNAKLDIVGKVSGDRYSVNGVGYDQWYKVKSNGQTGYVAAYYVDGGDNGGSLKYSSALNPNSTIYSEHLASANPYKAAIKQAAAPYSSWLKPSVLAAIGSRESGWGIFLDSNGTGDGGHGRGIMQIDDRYHQNFINNNNWRDPGVNIKYATDNVLAEYYSYLDSKTNLQGFDLLRGAIAAYNAGPGNVVDAVNAGLDVDAYTTGGDYSWDVIQRAGWFQDNGWA